MHRLYVLGRVDLLDANGTEVRSVLAQTRRLALLAYLALCSARGASRRDRLFGMFWPELSQERARQSLNKAVHYLRRTLGEAAIISRNAEELSLDTSHVWCDATAFVDAIDHEQMSEALELYRGELLPAFYIDDAAEFEAWVDGERTQLRGLAARAANAVAQQRERDGLFTTAIALARRAVELADEDERAVRQLLGMLDRLGDRAGALYAYDKFARRLAAEFGAEPAAETRTLIEQVRARSEPIPIVQRVETPSVLPPQSTTHSEQSLTATFRARGYAIERELGRGGMATVYLAHDLKHDRQVALKVLAPEVGALHLADRFAAEIQVTARLNHPNILPLFDSGNAGGMLYYTMPFIEGESLRARLQRERELSIDEALRLVGAVADALEYAHQCGIVHRDIKPENILIRNGQPLLADFGIALALSSAGVERITSTGLSVGTPQYMSPEQAAGELAVGPQSDIYSLAAVAYELLVGEPPFTGPNTQAVLARVMLEPPRPIRTVRTSVPESIESAILKALAKHAADRFANAADFADALRETRTAVVRRIFPRTRTLVRLGAFAVTVGALLSLPLRRPPVYIPGRVLVVPMENQTGDPALDGVAAQLLATLPDAIAREGVGEPVPSTTLHDLLTQASGAPGAIADRLARETKAGLQVRGACFRASGSTTCQVNLLRMPAKVLRMSVSVTGDPAQHAFGAELTDRQLAALFLQQTWGDRVEWQGEYLPRSLAAVRAFKQAWDRGEWQYLAEAIRLDTGWVAAAAWAAPDSSRSVAESLLARLARRPGLRDGEREVVAFALAGAVRRDAEEAFQLALRRFRVNPEFWVGLATYWAQVTGRAATAVSVSGYADSVVDASHGRVFNSKLRRGYAFHHLGQYRQQLELAHELERRFPSAVLVYRTEELMALAALGQVDSVRARLARWEATPEPADRDHAGSRAYIAGLELMAHGNVSDGRAVLARTLPLYRRLREAGEFHSELVEILTVTGQLKEAWATALTDLRSMKTPEDSMGIFVALGAIAARQGRLDDALRYDRLLVAAGKRAAARYDRLLVAAEKRARLAGDIAYGRALLAGYRNDRESAVRFLEEAQTYGQAEHRFVHREPGLIGMLDYPPFQEFLRPRP